MVAADKFGYQSHQIKDASGKVLYEAPPIEELIRWRLWDRTGAGLMGELGSHQLDAAGLYVAAAHDGKTQYPLAIAASAGRPLFPPDREANDHVYCIVEFPAPGYDPKDPLKNRNKIGVQYAALDGNDFGGYGEIVYGTKRTLLLERERAMSIVPDPAAAVKVSISAGKPAVLDTQASASPDVVAARLAADPDANLGYKEEIEHWAWCVRTPAQENKPRCHPAVALCDAVIVHAANMSAGEGRPIQFKEDWFTIESNDTPEGIAPDLTRYK